MKDKKGWLLVVTGMVAGAILGYVYQHMNSCSSGYCLITSSPLNASIYGSIMGGLFFSLFNKEKTENK